MLLTDIKISRPSRWLLLLGSFMIGAISADTTDFFWPALAVFAFYFTFPANILIYGINDIFDHEVDKHDPTRTSTISKLQRWHIVNIILLWNLPFYVVWLADEMPVASKWALLGFLFFGVFYSAWPIRARSKPILDSFFNILYVFPGLFAYSLLEYQFPPWQILAAATCWAAAVHAYSAIPKAKANKKAGINTVATLLRPIGTLMFCLALFAAAAGLSYPWLKMFSVGAGVIYLFIVLITFVRNDPAKPFFLYKVFRYINILVATGLFFYIATVTK